MKCNKLVAALFIIATVVTMDGLNKKNEHLDVFDYNAPQFFTGSSNDFTWDEIEKEKKEQQMRIVQRRIVESELPAVESDDDELDKFLDEELKANKIKKKKTKGLKLKLKFF